MINCERCQIGEAITSDYRPKFELWANGTVFDYRTPLEYYNRYLVCYKCFMTLDHKEWYKKIMVTHEEGKFKGANSV